METNDFHVVTLTFIYFTSLKFKRFMVPESWILYHTGDFPYYSVPVSLKDSFYMIYQTHMETGSIIISKYDPCLLLMSSCKIAKTIKVDKIIINTSSVSKESLTSSRFKIGNLLL